MSKKIHFFLNASYIGVDAILQLFILLIVILGRRVGHGSWLIISISAAIFLALHIVWISPLFLFNKNLRREWYLTFFGAMSFLLVYTEDIKKIRFLRAKAFKQNHPTETVVVLGYPDFSYIEAWLREHVSFEELRALSDLLVLRERDFSFYPMTDISTVDFLMSDPRVKRVYFVGHGSKCEFGLSNDLTVEHKNFNAEKHAKEFVHQVHCGHGGGDRLIDRVVAEPNRNQCFFFPKIITTKEILVELKRLTLAEKELLKKKTAV